MRNGLISGLGECRLACTPQTPGDFQDPSCPVSQRTCYPEDGNFYCRSSDAANPVGTQCEGGEIENELGCAAGALCARNVKIIDNSFRKLTDVFLGPNLGINETSECRQTCRPFLAREEHERLRPGKSWLNLLVLSFN